MTAGVVEPASSDRSVGQEVKLMQSRVNTGTKVILVMEMSCFSDFLE